MSEFEAVVKGVLLGQNLLHTQVLGFKEWKNKVKGAGNY
jgi:hypothetical protein